MKLAQKVLIVYLATTAGVTVMICGALYLSLKSITAFLFTVPVVVLGMSLFWWLVNRLVVRPMELLVSGVREIYAGGASKPIEIKSKDEIGFLASALNGMTIKLRESRGVSEEKVNEKTAELAKTVKESEEKNRALAETKKAVFDLLAEVDKEKKKAMEERDKIDTILHSIGEGVFVIDTDHRIILINQIAADMSGSKIETCLSRRYDEALRFVYERDESMAATFVQEAMDTGEMKGMTTHTMLLKTDGEKIAVATSASPLKDGGGKVIGCVVVFRDVTRERNIDRMKTEFISLASHQLRTPLSAMKWFAEMLISGDAGKLTDEQREFVVNIYQSNERMIELVNSLLDVSRIESGRIIIDPRPTDLVELVKEVEPEIKQKVEEKKQNFVISAHENLPKINVDPKLIREVYKNLLTNAVKYTPEGGEIDVFISRKDEDIISQVSDNGYGVPKAEQGKVFQKFFRADNIVKRETEGTGLGLYLAKAIVESSGGRIWFESEEGKGTSFWFSLPMAGTKPKAGEVGLNT
jgi:PAS domain S-box-containing protein